MRGIYPNIQDSSNVPNGRVGLMIDAALTTGSPIIKATKAVQNHKALCRNIVVVWDLIMVVINILTTPRLETVALDDTIRDSSQCSLFEFPR
jgi:orotate phosphoribosyltransferase